MRCFCAHLTILVCTGCSTAPVLKKGPPPLPVAIRMPSQVTQVAAPEAPSQPKFIMISWLPIETNCITGIDSTTNLLAWTPEVRTTPDVSGTNLWKDYDSSRPCKFYRALNE